MALELFGHGMVRSTVHEAISIVTTSGRVEIVPKGTELPFPKVGRWASPVELRVPRSCATGTLDLRVEIEAGTDGNLLESRVWSIPAPVEKGEPLCVLAAMDENKLLHVMLASLADGDNPLSLRIENPVTRVVNPGAVRLRIEETERALDAGTVSPDAIGKKLQDLGRDYAEIGFREKALDRYRRALKRTGRSDASILLQMGLISAELGDTVGEEKYYLEAAAASPSFAPPLFNLALAKWRRSELDEARRHVDVAIERTGKAAYYVLKAKIAKAARDESSLKLALDRAEAEFAPVGTLDDFELYWFETYASMRNDSDLVKRTVAERKRRSKSSDVLPVANGELPDAVDGLASGAAARAATGTVN